MSTPVFSGECIESTLASEVRNCLLVEGNIYTYFNSFYDSYIDVSIISVKGNKTRIKTIRKAEKYITRYPEEHEVIKLYDCKKHTVTQSTNNFNSIDSVSKALDAEFPQVCL